MKFTLNEKTKTDSFISRNVFKSFVSVNCDSIGRLRGDKNKEKDFQN